MGSAERIVDVEIGAGSQLLRKGRIIFGLLLVKAHVFQEQHGSIGHLSDLFLDRVPNAIVCLVHRAAEQLGQTIFDGCQAKLILRSVFGTAQVGRE
eukprot:scaffold324_cov326-Pavlova_lutheri.AAC.19